MGRDVSPSFKKNGLDYQNIVIFAGYNIDSLSLMKSLLPSLCWGEWNKQRCVGAIKKGSYVLVISVF